MLCTWLEFSCTTRSLIKIPTVVRLLTRIHSIVSFGIKSTIACHALNEKQRLLNVPQYKLISDVATTWSRTYAMLDHLLEQQAPICAALRSTNVRKSVKELWTLLEAHISGVEDVAKAVKPLKIATNVRLEEKTPTVSIISPLDVQLIHSAPIQATDSAVMQDIKNAITEDLEKQYESNKHSSRW